MFWKSQGLNPHLHKKIRFFKKRDYYLTEYPNNTRKQFTKMSLPHNINNIGFTIFFYKKIIIMIIIIKTQSFFLTQ